jgi:hypothetical protein
VKHFGIVTAAAITVAAGTLSGIPVPLAAAATPVWSASKVYKPAPYSLTAISCPTTDACVAMGDETDGSAVIYATTDGGATWKAEKVPSVLDQPHVTSSALTSASCSSPTTCEAVGYSGNAPVIIGTTDGGATWTPQPFPTGVAGNFTGISCPSAKICEAVSNTVILGTTDGGESWGTQTYPAAGSNGLTGISCASTAVCEAVGNVSGVQGTILFGTTNADAPNGAATWRAQRQPSEYDTGGSMQGVACPTVSTCEAVGTFITGAVILGTTNADAPKEATWTSQTAPALAGDTLTGISCPSSSTCEAVGYEQPAGPGTPISPVVLGSTNRGTTWRAQPLPGAETELLQTRLLGIGCPARTSTCEAVGGAGAFGGVVLRTRTAGTKWAAQNVRGGPNSLDTVACVDSAVCIAGGNYGPQGGLGMVLESTNAASIPSTWNTVLLPGGSSSFADVACPTSRDCEAVGVSSIPVLLSTTSATGADPTWVSQDLPAGVASLDGISCASATDCEAVGVSSQSQGPVVLGTINANSGTKAVWRAQFLPPGISNLYAVTCATTQDCQAVGQQSNGFGAVIGTTDADAYGAVWRTQYAPTSTAVGPLDSIACPLPSRCEGVGKAYINGGLTVAIVGTTDATRSTATWTAQTVPAGSSGYSLYGISCATVTVCETVGDSGEPAPGEDSSPLILGTTNGGGTWLSQQVPTAASYLLGISCKFSARFSACEAVGGNADGGSVILSYHQPTLGQRVGARG